MKKGLAIAIFTVFALAIFGGAQALAKEEMYPNKVKTHIGTLAFDHGIPTEETS